MTKPEREPLWRHEGISTESAEEFEWRVQQSGDAYWLPRALELGRAGWIILTTGHALNWQATDAGIRMPIGPPRVGAMLLSLSLENVFKMAAISLDWSHIYTTIPGRIPVVRLPSHASRIPRDKKRQGEISKELATHNLTLLAGMAGASARTLDETDVLEGGTHLIYHFGRYPSGDAPDGERVV
jgi:hypothetical protein